MRIVVNADDFGGSADTVEATIACFERGALTSATIMPNMPATDRAVEYARAHPEFSFGVHLTLTGDGRERPLSPPGEIAGLVGRGGALLPTRTVRVRAVTGRLSPEEIAREIEAQIEHVRGRGVPVSHVDSHRHVHKLAPFRTALSRALPRLGIRRVRSAQDVWLRSPLLQATYWWGPRWRRALAGKFVTTDHFYMPSSAGDTGWAEPLLEHVRRLPGRTLEVGVHPGTEEEWRADEQRSVAQFARRAREEGHELAAWTEIGDLGGGKTAS
jgi:predicted glycoside hydrolase/deacetylase ChbG (UPF0249 family)